MQKKTCSLEFKIQLFGQFEYTGNPVHIPEITALLIPKHNFAWRASNDSNPEK